MRKKSKFEVYQIEAGTLLLETEYDNSGKVALYSSLKYIDYDRHITIASGDDPESFIKDVDSLVAALQTIRQELLGVKENCS